MKFRTLKIEDSAVQEYVEALRAIAAEIRAGLDLAQGNPPNEAVIGRRARKAFDQAVEQMSKRAETLDTLAHWLQAATVEGVCSMCAGEQIVHKIAGSRMWTGPCPLCTEDGRRDYAAAIAKNSR